MNNYEFKSILEIKEAFPDEATCIEHLEHLKWENDKVVSPFSSCSKVYICKNNNYRCKNTSKYFNVKTGTLFSSTKVSLQKWFIAIWLITIQDRSISSLELANEIGVTQKTAGSMLSRIRKHY